MGAQLQLDWIGITRRQLEMMPKILAEDATRIAARGIAEAHSRVRIQYVLHRVTGNLLKGLSVKVVSSDPLKVAHKVSSNQFHAHLFEMGTAPRQNKRKANRGAAKPQNVIASIMPPIRAAFYRDIKAMMERYGLQVSGDA